MIFFNNACAVLSAAILIFLGVSSFAGENIPPNVEELNRKAMEDMLKLKKDMEKMFPQSTPAAAPAEPTEPAVILKGIRKKYDIHGELVSLMCTVDTPPSDWLASEKDLYSVCF